MSGPPPLAHSLRIPRVLLLPALLVAAAWAPATQAQSPPGIQPTPSPCSDSMEPDPVPLTVAWEESRQAERGYVAARRRVAAEDAARLAILRERAPTLSLETLGNWGQRLSPGEERVLGVGTRGDLRLLGDWTLLDSSRRWRILETEFRQSGASADVEWFSALHLAEVARIYLEAGLAEEIRRSREDHLETLQALAEPVRQRLAAGVDVAWEVHLLEEALARAHRLFTEAAQHQAMTRVSLSARVGRCVRPSPITTAAEHWRPPELADGQLVASSSPTVIRLRSQVDAQEARAQAEDQRDRWQLRLLGTTGPTRSRAFDDSVETEYLIGISGSWRPDLAGVQGRSADAERARAGALRAEAESLKQGIEGELSELAVVLEHATDRALQLALEVERTEERLEIALLRWREGVDRWTEVTQASERLQEARLLEIELRREMTLSLLRWGELSGDLAPVPVWFGQEGTR